jgi:UDP-N-acetyl-2-amino-2-deoxyglucuronate dehydrogenase
MSKKLRFAIIGCGVIGKNHAKDIASITENAELVAVADAVEKSAKELAEQYDVVAYTDYNEMLKRDDIDIVNICTPSGMHAENAIACAKAGKHCIVEKPMEITLQKADKIINAFKAAGKKLAVVSQHRFDSATLAVKRDIEDGKFGKLILGTAAINWYRSQAYYDSGQWRGTWGLDGGGALMNQSIHTIDLLQSFMGPVESVFAFCETLGHERIEVEDTAVATVKFKSGAVGTIVGTTCAYPGLSTRVELFGNKGTAIIENDVLIYKRLKDEFGEVGHYGVEESIEELKDSVVGGDSTSMLNQSHKCQFEDMIKAIHENREPMINGTEGRAPLEIILGIYHSAKINKSVSFPFNEV